MKSLHLMLEQFDFSRSPSVAIFLMANIVFAGISATERASLIALYNSTNGDSWTNNTGWKTAPLDTDGFAMPGTEGGWFGVTAEGNLVIKIVLQLNQLTGSIPADIGNLVHLRNLELGRNELSGVIPADLGNLAMLETLYLHANKLSGNIPAALGNLSNLQHLSFGDGWFGGNQLSGSIPVELGNLVKLTYLNLQNNQLTGSIPEEIGNLVNLESLCLASNQLTGSIPAEIGNPANLKSILLDSNQLTGNIPAALGNLATMTGVANSDKLEHRVNEYPMS
ncbi:MAG: leucine-rich repeat domain-containing protein [Pseudomonadota bacterium]